MSGNVLQDPERGIGNSDGFSRKHHKSQNVLTDWLAGLPKGHSVDEEINWRR